MDCHLFFWARNHICVVNVLVEFALLLAVLFLMDHVWLCISEREEMGGIQR